MCCSQTMKALQLRLITMLLAHKKVKSRSRFWTIRDYLDAPLSAITIVFAFLNTSTRLKSMEKMDNPQEFSASFPAGLIQNPAQNTVQFFRISSC